MKIDTEQSGASSLTYSTLVGGSQDEIADSLAIDAGGSAYVTGGTDSTDLPIVNGYQAAGTGNDAYVAVVNPNGSALVYSTYTITATNNGPSAATGVTIVDTAPSQTAFVSAPANCSGSPTMTCTVGTLAAGASATVTLGALVDPGASGTISNTATVSGAELDPVPANNIAPPVITPVTKSADLLLTKTASPGPSVNVGSVLTYSLSVKNNGPSDATNVVVSDKLPVPGVTVQSAPGCSGSSTLTCTTPKLASGATLVFIINVMATAPGKLGNTAKVTSAVADPNMADNTSSVTTLVPSADLSLVQQAAAPFPLFVGQTITYTITVTNQGPSQADDVMVSDPIPSTVNFVSASPSCGLKAGTVFCKLGNMAPNSTMARTVTVQTKGGQVVNTATVTSTSGTYDPNLNNNTQTLTTFVFRKP